MTNSKASFVSTSAALGLIDLDSIEWAMQAPLWKLEKDEVLLETVVDGGYCLWSTLWGASATPSLLRR